MVPHLPRNDFTEMIERAAAANRSGIRGMGVASATPLPTAQSADLGRIAAEPPPLTDAERAELDQRAREAGIKDESLGNVGDQPQGAYPTLDAAVAAGAPVNIPPVVYRARALEARTATEFTARESRLPNFTRVQGIDLLRGRVLIDDMEFPISESDARDFKQYVVETARAAIMAKLTEAASLFATPETAEVSDGGASSAQAVVPAVQQQSPGDSPEPAV